LGGGGNLAYQSTIGQKKVQKRGGPGGTRGGGGEASPYDQPLQPLLPTGFRGSDLKFRIKAKKKRLELGNAPKFLQQFHH